MKRYAAIAFVLGALLGGAGATAAQTAWTDRYVCTWYSVYIDDGRATRERLTDECNRRALSGTYSMSQATGLHALILERPKIVRLLAGEN
jgi:hypothetical protein